MISEFLPDRPALFRSRYATGDSPATIHNCQLMRPPDGSLLADNGALFPGHGRAQRHPRVRRGDPAEVGPS
jgi:hypothetical protein